MSNTYRLPGTYRHACRLDGTSGAAARTGTDADAGTGAVQQPDACNDDCLCGHDFAHDWHCLCRADGKNRFTAVDVCFLSDRMAASFRRHSGYTAVARGGDLYMGFYFEPSSR